MARALREPGPCLIHAPIDVYEKVYPMVPPGAANKDMIGGELNVADLAARLPTYKILIVLDLCHTQGARTAWEVAKGASGGTPEYYCDQPPMSAAAANLIVNWVNNGGRMMTKTGYHNYGYQDGTPESTNVNMLIRPFGVTYSITTNPNEVRIFGAKTDITGFTASTSPIPTAILNGPSGAVSRLMINAGAKIKGWTGTADGALPPNSNNFITGQQQASLYPGLPRLDVSESYHRYVGGHSQLCRF